MAQTDLSLKLITTEGISFVGEVQNALLQAEDQNGNPAFRVLGGSYWGNKNSFAIYDNKGLLMKGTEALYTNIPDGIDVQSKPIAVRLPAQPNLYLLFIRSKNGNYSQITIDTDLKGNGTVEEPLGEYISDKSIGTFGRHAAAIEDYVNKQAHIFFTTTTGSNQRSLVRYTLSTATNASLISLMNSEIPAFLSSDTQGDGEIQIAPDASSISLYNASSNYAYLPFTQAELRTWPMKNYLLGSEYSLQTSITGGNIGKASLSYDKTQPLLYYTQLEVMNALTATQTGGRKAFSQALAQTQSRLIAQNVQGDIRMADQHPGYLYSKNPISTTAGTQVFVLSSQSSTSSVSSFTSTHNPTGFISQAPVRIWGKNPGEYLVVRTLGMRQYELKDHLGNIRATVSDKKTDTGEAEVQTASNYYPFGAIMPGRNFNSNFYMFGFQGQLKTDEISGSGNHVDYNYRGYNPRTGKFWSIDPLAPDYPHNSPYAFSENRVIDGIELEGLEYYTYRIYFQGNKKVKTTLVNHTNLKDGYGSQGAGVAYVKVKLDLKGKIESQKQVKFIKNDYGIYAGGDPNNPTNAYIEKGKGYDYHLPAIDATDQVAKNHDKEYDAVDAIGENDFWGNPITIEADQRAVDSWNKIEGNGSFFRMKATILFESVIAAKKLYAVQTYLENHGYGRFKNSKVEDALVNKLGGKQKVYEMWRSENMTQGSDGVWLKKK